MTLLSELKRLRESATPKPWDFDDLFTIGFGPRQGQRAGIICIPPATKSCGGLCVMTNDAELIALQRNCLDEVIALVEAAQEMYVGVMTEDWPVSSQIRMKEALKPFLYSEQELASGNETRREDAKD